MAVPAAWPTSGSSARCRSSGSRLTSSVVRHSVPSHGGYIASGLLVGAAARVALGEPRLRREASSTSPPRPCPSRRGQRVTRAIRAGFGDRLIENLWLPFFCLSSNLSRGEVTVHDRGSLWQAMRASVSIPGLWPPVRSEEGDILVDGGVMNNLPVDVMQTFYDGGVIIAVNLRGTSSLPSVGLSRDRGHVGLGPDGSSLQSARRVGRAPRHRRPPAAIDRDRQRARRQAHGARGRRSAPSRRGGSSGCWPSRNSTR